MKVDAYGIAALVASQVLTAVAVVATLKADVRWIRKWCDDHAKQDDVNFQDVRTRLGNLGG